MHLIQLLLPGYDNAQQALPQGHQKMPTIMFRSSLSQPPSL